MFFEEENRAGQPDGSTATDRRLHAGRAALSHHEPRLNPALNHLPFDLRGRKACRASIPDDTPMKKCKWGNE
jgi:hypothetical protein